MQLPILSGVKSGNGGFQTSYPINMEHRLVESGLSKGQLTTTRGIVEVVQGPGMDRGGCVYNGAQYRVMGSSLVRIEADDSITAIGDVGSDALPVGFTESFDQLAVRSSESLYYYDGDTLFKVADNDLGRVLDVTWIDGYFATTDGEFVVVTDLLDPTQVDALRYGSAESDPDPLVGVMSYREELYAFGRYTIQPFRNAGTTGFPFQNVRGALIPFGCVSANAKCKIGGTFAFVGGGKDEPVGVYVASQGGAVRISDTEIDAMLADTDPAAIVMEGRTFGDEQHLVIHLSDRAVVLSLRAASGAGEGTWHIAHSGDRGRYRGRFAVYHGGKHYVGDTDSAALGVLTRDTPDHYGVKTTWQFDAGLLFNSGTGMLVKTAEIFGTFPNRPAQFFMAMTRDGEVWSNRAMRRIAGKRGERVVWRPNTRVAQIAGFRFSGTDRVSVARAEIDPEPLAV